MKRHLLILLSLLVVFMLPACGGADPAPPPQAETPSTQEESEEPSSEEETPEPSTPEEREAYIEKVENELKQLDDRIVELKDMAARGGTATAERSKKALKELEEKRKAAQEKLVALKDATKSATYERVKDIF
jgi:TolA-binding protein